MLSGWNKAKLYLKKAATVILAASLVLWVLLNFPRDGAMEADFGRRIKAAKSASVVQQLRRL